MLRVCYTSDEYKYGDSLTEDEVVDIYKMWRDESEYVMLRRTQWYEMGIDRANLFPDNDYFFVKVPKRGNDVFQRNLRRKLEFLDNQSPMKYFKDDQHPKHTNLLFLTLSYDTNRCPTITAWENIGEEFNNFISKIKQEFGDVSYFRCWESYSNYYPHVHVVIHFKEHAFRVHEHLSEDGNKTWRIPSAQKNKIQHFWHSFVDVQGVQDVQNAFKYLHKYLTKTSWSKKGEKSQAMAWVHNKQTYAISASFCDDAVIEDVNPNKEDEIVDDLIDRVMANSNIDYEFMGLIPGRCFSQHQNEWSFAMKHPPPKVLDIAEQQQQD